MSNNSQPAHRDVVIHGVFTRRDMMQPEKERWNRLCQGIGNHYWWVALFNFGAFIAGGAALFVVDDRQCILDVGDIDIWWPFSLDKLNDHLRWLKGIHHSQPEGVQPKFYAGGCCAAVVFPQMKLQFINVGRARPSPEAMLKSFDMTYLQVAIVCEPEEEQPPPAIEQPSTVQVLYTRKAEDAWRYRETEWTSHDVRAWQCPGNSNALMISRIEKMARKGFTMKLGSLPVKERHVCTEESCEWSAATVPIGYIDDSRMVQTLYEFSETNYEKFDATK